MLHVYVFAFIHTFQIQIWILTRHNSENWKLLARRIKNSQTVLGLSMVWGYWILLSSCKTGHLLPLAVKHGSCTGICFCLYSSILNVCRLVSWSSSVIDWHLLHVHIWLSSHHNVHNTPSVLTPRLWSHVCCIGNYILTVQNMISAVPIHCNEVLDTHSFPVCAVFVLLGADWLQWWACSPQPAGPVPRVPWLSVCNSWSSANDFSCLIHTQAHTHSCILVDTQANCEHIAYTRKLYRGCYCCKIWPFLCVCVCVCFCPSTALWQMVRLLCVIMMNTFLDVLFAKVELWPSSSVWTYKKYFLVKIPGCVCLIKTQSSFLLLVSLYDGLQPH